MLAESPRYGGAALKPALATDGLWPVQHAHAWPQAFDPRCSRGFGFYRPLTAASLASASSLPMPRSAAMAANASGLGLALPASQA